MNNTTHRYKSNIAIFKIEDIFEMLMEPFFFLI